MISPEQRWRRYRSTPRDLRTYRRYPCQTTGPSELDRLIQHTVVTPISAVQWHCEEDWGLYSRQDPDSSCYYVEYGHGHGWFEDNAERFTINPGDLLLLPENTTHSLLPDAGVRFRFMIVHFFAHYRGTIDLLRLADLRGTFPAARNAPFRSASQEMTRDFAVRAPGWERSMESHIWRILLYVVRHFANAGGITPYRTLPAALKRLLPALDVVADHFHDPRLKVRHLASAVCLSEPHLRLLMQSTIGMGPVTLIRRKRIEAACRLLHGTDDTVETIAHSCGFHGADYFHRVFKQLTGRTPTEYRNRRS